MAHVFDAFTTETVARLTGLSRRQLAYWDKTGFFSPTHLDRDRPGGPHSRIYSFRDLVGLRTIALLRSHGVTLQELRKVGAWLHQYESEPWSRLRFATSGGKVYVREPQTGAMVRASKPAGQAVISWELETIANDTARALSERTDDQIGEIEHRRSVLNNAAVIAGTRIPTSMIFDFHAAGYSTAQILDEYPQLRPADIRAAVEFEERARTVKAAG